MATDIKHLAAVTALNDMMRRRRVDICAIREIAALLQVHPEPESYKVLQTLHCVDFDHVEPELRKAIPALVQRCLQGEAIFQFSLKRPEPLVVESLSAPKKGLLRLIGFGG